MADMVDPLAWLKTLGPYPATLILLVALAPTVLNGWGGAPSSTALEYHYWSSTLISGALVVASIFASQQNLSGPLRFGLAKYAPSFQTFVRDPPDGIIWTLLLARVVVPWTHTWLTGLLSAWWHFTLQNFREAVRDASDQTRDLCARATIAAEQGAEAAAAAARYEADALASGAQAARNARTQQGTSASDFFDAASSAWSAINSAAANIGSAHGHSATASNNADSAAREWNSSSGTANSFASYTRSAASQAESANTEAQAALHVMTDFQAARDHDRGVRQRASAEQKRALSVARDLIAKTGALPAAAKALADGAQAARHKAMRSLALVEQGRTAEAASAAIEAANTVKGLEVEARRIADVKAEARQLCINLALDG